MTNITEHTHIAIRALCREAAMLIDKYPNSSRDIIKRLSGLYPYDLVGFHLFRVLYRSEESEKEAMKMINEAYNRPDTSRPDLFSYD